MSREWRFYLKDMIEFAELVLEYTEDYNLFDALYQQKDAIEAAFGHELEWLRLDDKKAPRVQYVQVVDGHDKANWPEMIEWLVKHMIQLEKAVKQALGQVNSDLKMSRVGSEVSGDH